MKTGKIFGILIGSVFLLNVGLCFAAQDCDEYYDGFCDYGTLYNNTNSDCKTYCNDIEELCCTPACEEACNGDQACIDACTDDDVEGSCEWERKACRDQCDALEEDAENGVSEAITFYEDTCYQSFACRCETYVELSSLDAEAGCGEVAVTWETAVEIDSVGFNVYRSVNGENVQVNNAVIPATGSATEGADYEIIDTGVKNGVTYTYILEEIDASGSATIIGEATATPRLIYIFK